jgi:endonuclease YncB( thermonuclease family)
MNGAACPQRRADSGSGFHKSRRHYRHTRQRGSYGLSARRLISRELRYFRRKFLTAGAVLISVVVGFLSEGIDSVPLAQLRHECPTDTNLHPNDVVGRASVIDGDTLEIHGQRIRLWGVDAPESAQQCHIDRQPWRCGQQAALSLSDHIGQQTVTCVERDRDRYGRIVAKCSVAAQDVGEWLVSNGWALDYSNYSGGHYSSHQASAASARLGIWRGQFDKPWEWRRTNR